MCGCMKPNCAIHRIYVYMYVCVCVLWPIVKLAKHYRVMLMMNRPNILRIIILLSKWIWLMCIEIFRTLYIFSMRLIYLMLSWFLIGFECDLSGEKLYIEFRLMKNASGAKRDYSSYFSFLMIIGWFAIKMHSNLD